MFTQQCQINKNTEELRKKLEELGIKMHPTIKECNGNTLYVNRGFYAHIPIGYEEEIDASIDCDTNEELFLALAALRDDTDKNQWFIYDSMDAIIKSFRIYEWFVCDENRIEDMLFYDCHYLNAHKASVKEIFDHFIK